MGNSTSSQRYITNAEAVEALGNETYARIKGRLGSLGGKIISYDLFSNLIQKKFEKIPRILCESLYRAFTSDIGKPVDIDVFVSSLALIETSINSNGNSNSNDPTLAKFLYKIYENDHGVLVRRRVEEILIKAYSPEPTKSLFLQQLDIIFGFDKHELSMKEFELSYFKLGMLSGWVKIVLSVFLESASYMRLSALERKYSSLIESEEFLNKFGIPSPVCDYLRREFNSLCSLSGSSEEAAVVPDHMDCNTWLRCVSGYCNNDVIESRKNVMFTLERKLFATDPVATFDSKKDDMETQKSIIENTLFVPGSTPYLSLQLAAVMFQSRVDAFKPTWRFMDFAEFCAVFGAGDRTSQVNAVCEAFIQQALHLYQQQQQRLQSEKQYDSILEKRRLQQSGNRKHNSCGHDEDLTLLINWQQKHQYSPLPFQHKDAITLSESSNNVTTQTCSNNDMKQQTQQQQQENVLNNDVNTADDVEEEEEDGDDEDNDIENNNTNTHIDSEYSIPNLKDVCFKTTYVHQLLSVDEWILSALTNMIYILALPYDHHHTHTQNDNKHNVYNIAVAPTLPTDCCIGTFKIIHYCNLPEPLRSGLSQLLDRQQLAHYHYHRTPQQHHIHSITTVQTFAQLLLDHYELLPGLRDLCITACCCFGVTPPTPLLEMEYITELSLRHLQQQQRSASSQQLQQQFSYGPVGTEWCILSKQWYDSWRIYVGHQHHHQIQSNSNRDKYQQQQQQQQQQPNDTVNNTTASDNSQLLASTLTTKNNKERSSDSADNSNSSNNLLKAESAASRSSNKHHHHHNLGISAAMTAAATIGKLRKSSSSNNIANINNHSNNITSTSVDNKNVNKNMTNKNTSDNSGMVRSNNTSSSGHVHHPHRLGFNAVAAPQRPGPIDNWSIVVRRNYNNNNNSTFTTTSKRMYQLLPDVQYGQDIEVIAPIAYSALLAWYGATCSASNNIYGGTSGNTNKSRLQLLSEDNDGLSGPRIIRRVVAYSDSNSSSINNTNHHHLSRNHNLTGGSSTSSSSAGIGSAVMTRTRTSFTSAATTIANMVGLDVDSIINPNSSSSAILSAPFMQLMPSQSTDNTDSNRHDTNNNSLSNDSTAVITSNYTETSSSCNNSGASSSSFLLSTTAAVVVELELFPLCIRICTCDNHGQTHSSNGLFDNIEHELLFSRTATIEDVAQVLAGIRNIDVKCLRLWNYASVYWKEQYILSPELNLLKANIHDGQIVLVEISLSDGAWPRSLLHASLDSQERAARNSEEEGSSDENGGNGDGNSAKNVNEGSDSNSQIGSGTTNNNNGISSSSRDGDDSKRYTNLKVTNNSCYDISDYKNGVPINNTIAVAKKMSHSFITATPFPVVQYYKRNNGLVGLDNLGNTCYMNSSLQALLHTEPLVEYFLSQAYMQHLNMHNIHGFKGKLAQSFGKLAYELWTVGQTPPNNSIRIVSNNGRHHPPRHYKVPQQFIIPRTFKHDVAALRDQFAGNEQHDAHELLAFLLDGLSEDLNLVHDKPYITQPDSDGRPDEEIADIWWKNHLQRDRSVVQAIFSGQFKSVMSCTTEGCHYTSARFEPFNFLSVPIPDDAFRVITVTVVPLRLQHSTYCAVKMPTVAGMTLKDLVEQVKALQLPGLIDDEEEGEEGVIGEIVRNGDGSMESKLKQLSSEQKLDKLSKKARAKLLLQQQQRRKQQYDSVLFQAGELFNNRIKSFHNLDRPIEVISERENIILFQIRRLSGIISTNTTSKSQSVPLRPGTTQTASDNSQYKYNSNEKDNSSSYNACTGANSGNLCKEVEKNDDSDNKMLLFDEDSLPPLEVPLLSNISVRVAFSQRTVRLYSGSSMGTDHFKIEPYGISLLEVLPSRIRCSDLYRMIARRFAPFLKSSVKSLVQHSQLQHLHSMSNTSLHSIITNTTATAAAMTTGTLGNDETNLTNSSPNAFKTALSSSSSNSFECDSENSLGGGGSSSSGGDHSNTLTVSSSAIKQGGNDESQTRHVIDIVEHYQLNRHHRHPIDNINSIANNLEDNSGKDSSSHSYPVNIRLATVQPGDTDEIIGGPIPEEGFTLRLVTGGPGNGTNCSRCPWLLHCQGCVLPDNQEVVVDLRDGESIAIDWHYVVFQDLLDRQAVSRLKKHVSVQQALTSASEQKTALSKCLDKFTEQESLDGVVCPRCHHSNGNMKQCFALWRLPPVLIIQLKRFQFDNISRRKLNNRIDFPFHDLDLEDYLATNAASATRKGRRRRSRGMSNLTTSTVDDDTATTTADRNSYTDNAETGTVGGDIQYSNTTTINVNSICDSNAENLSCALLDDRPVINCDSQLLAQQALYGCSMKEETSTNNINNSHNSKVEEEEENLINVQDISVAVNDDNDGRESKYPNKFHDNNRHDDEQDKQPFYNIVKEQEQKLQDNNILYPEQQPQPSSSSSCHYDLYSVVHHVGILGGGHYVTTVRGGDSSGNDASSGSNNSKSINKASKDHRIVTAVTGDQCNDSDNNNNSSDNKSKTSSPWYCFNDHIVSEVADPLTEIGSAPSAYLLFYMRQDVQQQYGKNGGTSSGCDIQALLRKHLNLAPIDSSSSSNSSNHHSENNVSCDHSSSSSSSSKQQPDDAGHQANSEDCKKVPNQNEGKNGDSYRKCDDNDIDTSTGASTMSSDRKKLTVNSISRLTSSGGNCNAKISKTTIREGLFRSSSGNSSVIANRSESPVSTTTSSSPSTSTKLNTMKKTGVVDSKNTHNTNTADSNKAESGCIPS